MNKILFFIFFNLGATVCGAQIYFNNVYDDTTHSTESCSNIVLLEDGSFIVPSAYLPSQGEFQAGYNIRHINPEGVELSQDNIIPPQDYVIYVNHSESFIPTSDGGYMQATAKGGAYLVKLNIDLSVQWEILVDSLTTFYRPLELANGNFFVCGYTYDTNHINLFWISPDGVVLDHTFANPYPQGNFYNILKAQELGNGDLLLSGFDGVGIDGNQMILRLDATGNVIWKKKFSYDYRDWGPFPIVESETMATAVFGHIDYVLNPDDAARDNFHGRLGTMQVDLLTGDTSNVLLYEPELAGYWITDFTKTPDNGYAILGYAVSQEQTIFYSFITKLNENRQFQWHKTYLHEPEEIDSTQFAYAWDFEVTADSGFVVAGHWDDLEMLGKQMPWVFKTDACGDLVWSNCGGVQVAEFNDSQIKRFNIYPNPSNTILNITSDSEFESITLRNLVGQVVHRAQLNNRTLQSQVDLSALASGVYLVEVCFGQGVVAAQKLVVE
jgi:Secretion system C-terminal sorting domain